MDEFCGGKFWDWDLTWNTTNPDFTPCFGKTALVWGPCGFLWAFAAIDILYSVNSRCRDIPRSPLSVTKYGITFVLIVLDLVLLYFVLVEFENVYPADYSATSFKAGSYVLYWILLYYSRKRGIRSSGVQFVFWFLLAVCEGINFRSAIIAWQNELLGKVLLNTPEFLVRMTSFPCVLGMLSLNCWADVPPKFSQDMESTVRPCPETSASFLSRIFYHWYSELAWKGYRKPLEFSDLWNLNLEDKSSSLVPIWEKYWSKELNRASKKRAKKSNTQAAYSKVSKEVDFSERQIKTESKQSASILPSLICFCGSTFIFGSLLKIVPDLAVFVSPQILKILIAYTSGNEETWKGIFYAAVLFLCAFFSSLFSAQYTYAMYLTTLRVRTALVSAIYRKALVISNVARRESTVGEIVNLMSVDIQKIMDLIPYVNLLWSAPFQIGLAIYFLWGVIGPSALAGLFMMFMLIPVNAWIAAEGRKLQVVQMKKKDVRIKMMNEILSGIKVLKLYAWEASFEQQVMKIRREEMVVLKKATYLQAGTLFLWATTPFLVSLSSFATFVLIDSNNVLDAEKVFVSLSLFNIINQPLMFLPMIVVLLVQASVSFKRLNKYMNAEELDKSSVSHDSNEKDPIVIENGTFAWDSETLTLKDINLRVTDGSLVAVVGTVGSGKSTLLSVLLGELDKICGRVNTKGSIAYVAQQAWIQNATLRDNILFGSPFDPAKYDKIVDSCALRPDIEILPAGDKTEIGERGINLSGGQKQRVSLARAVYNDADIYLLDDPLSAVDSHVGKHIFDQVVGPNGLLKKKTRILVTHGITYLPRVDNIIVIKDGKISEKGTYRELLDTEGAFAELLNHYMAEDNDSVFELEDPELLKDIEKVVGGIRTKLRSASDSSEKEIGSGVRLRRSVSLTKEKEMAEIQKKTSNFTTAKDKLIEVEKSETKSVKMNVYMDYFRAAGLRLCLGSSFLFFMVQALSVGSNLWLSEWANQGAVNGTQDPAVRDLYLGVYGAFGIVQGLVALSAAITLGLSLLKASANLHNKMLRNILRAPMSFFDTTPLGRIVNRFAKDVDVCDNTLPFNVRVWLRGFFAVFFIIVVICYSTPIFIAVMIPIAALYYFVQQYYVASSRQLKRLESVTRSPIYSHFSETLSGVSTIRAFFQQQRFILESEAKVDHNQVTYFPSIVANRWLALRLETIGSLIIFFAALFAVLGRDTLSSGIVGLSITYSLQITMFLFMLVRWTSDVETNIVAVERVKEYGETPQEATWESVGVGKKPGKGWPDKGEVKFQNYQTRYRPGLDLVLKNVTCTINPGEKVGVVGRTGAGKSSLTLALFRIIEPVNGLIEIDGQNISRLGLHDLRGRITIIPQDPVLFSGTLRINLDPFEQHTDETIWNSLESAHLKSFVQSLSAGLQHEVAEGGENLSVGQRQLVCLARALLRKTKILILDEATAAVDLETDDLIQQTIRTEFKDSTVITIAHRLNTIMDSTRVMVLDKGEIKEFDSPQNLLNKDSIFSSMAKDAGLT